MQEKDTDLRIYMRKREKARRKIERQTRRRGEGVWSNVAETEISRERARGENGG